MTTSLKQKLTFPLIIALILIAGIITGYVVINRLLEQPPPVKNLKIDSKAALKLNALKQISQKNGIKEWELNAASATLLKGKNKAVLKDISVIFFTRDNQQAHLTAENGELNTKTHDMTFSTNVVVTFQDAELRTDQLQYHKKKHIIRSDTHVTIKKQNSVIEADSMTTRLNDSTILLKGQVKGKFSENFRFQ